MKYSAVPLLILVLFPMLLLGQSLQKPFEECGLEGSITVYDLRKNQWTYSDPADARRASLPASTFKILNSLILLEEKTVKDEYEVLKWDGQQRSVAAWNADTDMKSAFANSTVWFYVWLAERLGKDKYQRWLKRCGYGNGQFINAQGADFWNYGDFAISPKSQIEFLRKFHAEKLPFSKETLRKVKQMMVVEQTPAYTLRAKTGWTNYAGTDSGWWVGYVETKENVYFFATRLHKDVATPNEHFANCRKTITRRILQQLNILPAS
ncbi:class D beta-lactamase [Rufibacter latericius]|uniref:Beta-lactamase n=1 Tax=Rufibacter latericius TaxID=2487040 RepID=A0A3M9MKC9_9BACT|nr:class D beta-lactamase [Rufibacter latericius]RNI26010.1 class D beta-lactamase [Rufibacter latericius]